MSADPWIDCRFDWLVASLLDCWMDSLIDLCIGWLIAW
jgi:hypothetical protein